MSESHNSRSTMSTKRALKKMRSEDESPTPKRAKKNVPYKKDTPERQGGHVKGQFEKEDSEEDEPEQEDDRIVEAKEQMTYLEDDVVVIYDVAYLTTEDDEHWDYKGNDITFVRTSKPHLNSKDRNDGRQVYKMFLRMRTLELDGEGPCGGFWCMYSSSNIK